MINQARSKDPEYAEKLKAKGQTVTLAAQVGALHGGQKLNPEFALWLMGYPTGWLDTAPPETQ
jgi:fructose/tagatose bisphosphate aldolase